MTLQKFVIATIVLLIGGCGGQALKREEISPQTFRQYPSPKLDELKQESPYLKAHMKDGGLYVFEVWKIDDERSNITGKGSRYDATRDPLGTRDYTVSIDSIALVETNILITSGATTAIAVFTGIEAAITVACLSNPKACFGSCPTFYASDGDSMRLQAERFSSSIAPSLEETDVDAMYFVTCPQKNDPG